MTLGAASVPGEPVGWRRGLAVLVGFAEVLPNRAPGDASTESPPPS